MSRDDTEIASIVSEVRRLVRQRMPLADAELVTNSFQQLTVQLRPLRVIDLRDSEPAQKFDPGRDWGAHEPT